MVYRIDTSTKPDYLLNHTKKDQTRLMVSTQNTGTPFMTGIDAQRYESLDRRFNSIVKRTQTTMMLERLWPRSVAPLFTGGLYVTTSWLGLWHGLPPFGKLCGLAAFTLVAGASVVPLVFKKLRVTRAEAITRLDQENGDPRQPAFMLNDRPSIGISDDGQRMFAARRFELLEEWVEKFSAGRRKSNVSVLPLYAMAGALAISAFTAGPHRLDSLSDAFNWKVPPVPVVAKAWITPPDNFRETAIVLDQNTKDAAHGGSKLEAHKSSHMTIVIFDRNARVTVNGEVRKATKSNIVKDPSQGKSSFQYELDLTEGENAIVLNKEVFWNIHVAPDAAPTAEIKGIIPNAKDATAPELEYIEKDDYGIKNSQIIITLPAPPAAGATPLPSTGTIPPVPLR